MSQFFFFETWGPDYKHCAGDMMIEKVSWEGLGEGKGRAGGEVDGGLGGLIEEGLSCLELFKQCAGQDQTPGNKMGVKYLRSSDSDLINFQIQFYSTIDF